MAEADGKPKVGRSARLLGVRLGIDIDIEEIPKDWLDAQGYLRPEAERKATGDVVIVAVRSTKGMSTSLSIESLPAFRRPTAFGGTGRDPLWQIEDSNIGSDLEAVQDSATHVSIMPRVTMLLEKYETALANAQNDWERVS
ncbi:Tse2 family ADP-ribosyltransferase toxin [Schleiferia thermophila]